MSTFSPYLRWCPDRKTQLITFSPQHFKGYSCLHSNYTSENNDDIKTKQSMILTLTLLWFLGQHKWVFHKQCTTALQPQWPSQNHPTLKTSYHWDTHTPTTHIVKDKMIILILQDLHSFLLDIVIFHVHVAKLFSSHVLYFCTAVYVFQMYCLCARCVGVYACVLYI